MGNNSEKEYITKHTYDKLVREIEILQVGEQEAVETMHEMQAELRWYIKRVEQLEQILHTLNVAIPDLDYDPE